MLPSAITSPKMYHSVKRSDTVGEVAQPYAVPAEAWHEELAKRGRRRRERTAVPDFANGVRSFNQWYSRHVRITPRQSLSLGGVDGSDQDDGASEGDEGAVVLGGFLAAERDTLEALELAHGLLDAGASLVEQIGEERGPVPGIGAVWDHRDDAARPAGRPVRLGVIALVGQRRPWPNIWPDVERGLQLRAVAVLAPGQVKAERQAAEVGLEVDLAGEPTPRPTERLPLLPLLRRQPTRAPAPRCCRTSAPSARSGSVRPAPGRTPRTRQNGSAARTASRRCSRHHTRQAGRAR